MKKQMTEKQKNKIPKTNNGITLIALVITIIVMLILVAVTITMAVNGGLFEYAGNAGAQTNAAIANEQELGSGKVTIGETTYNSIEEYLGTAGNGTVDVVPNPEEKYSSIYTETKDYTDKNNKTVKIPKGFAVGTTEGINTVDGGLVITDKVNDEGQSIGNEFVWIPVEVTDTDTQTSIASFYRSDWSNNARTTGLSTIYQEPYVSGYTDGKGTEEIAEYNAMVKSVYENGGFYIGRYEAGAQKQDEDGNIIARTDVANGTSKMVVQRDQYPYTYVGWGLAMNDYTSNVTYSSKDQGLGALALSKAMYANKDVGVTSTLCYGIQWDAMLDFIKDDTHNVSSSTTWGNYKNNAWTIDRNTAKYTTNPSGDTTWSLIDDEEGDSKTKDSSTSILLTTGASDDFAAKNIFDIAGNVMEWTNEAHSTSTRVYRGGNYVNYGGSYPASNRSYYDYSPDFCFNGLGFRAALYIK